MTELDSMTQIEFEHWRILEQIEPFGEAAANRRFALLACLLSSGRSKLKDYLRFFEPEAPMSSEQMIGAAQQMASANKGT